MRSNHSGSKQRSSTTTIESQPTAEKGEGLTPLPQYVSGVRCDLKIKGVKTVLELARMKKAMWSMKKIALLMCLLMTVFTGCSILVNSERFYGDRPRPPINWREYTTD
jgi:hypothetical protein